LTVRHGQATFWAYIPLRPQERGELVLLDNVQFVYELGLAQMELEALGVQFQVTNGLREFKVLSRPLNVEMLRRRVAYFRTIEGVPTDYFRIIQKNRTRSVNQYLTHWIYPYKGKFHPQMIRALLNIVGLQPGEIVLDPFVGSGTTAVEATLLGIDFIGFDISPLCVVQSRVKVESMKICEELERLVPLVIHATKPTLFASSNYSPQDIMEQAKQHPDGRVREFFQMAELLAHSDQARRGREFNASFIRNVGLMLSSVTDFRDIVAELGLQLGSPKIDVADVRHMPLAEDSVDGIITSPPYSIALDYVTQDAHALKALGCDLSEERAKFIGVRGKGPERIRLYNEDMVKSIREMARVLKPRRYCVIVIGNATYQGTVVPTVQFTTETCQKNGLQLVKEVDKIIYGLYNVMQTEKILIFQKAS